MNDFNDGNKRLEKEQEETNGMVKPLTSFFQSAKV
jgi:hypothetical protein